jgi:hypothetical protein
MSNALLVFTITLGGLVVLGLVLIVVFLVAAFRSEP